MSSTPTDERKAAEEWADEIVDDCESLANEHRKPIKIKCAMALRADLLSTKLAAMEAGRLRAENERLVASLKDWNSVDASLRRNIWELDVALNGEENAAPQASLCDLIEPARRLRAENAALRERGERMVPDEWRVRYYQIRGCISTDPMMDGTNKVRGVNIPILNDILEQHRNNPVDGANDADHH